MLITKLKLQQYQSLCQLLMLLPGCGGNGCGGGAAAAPPGGGSATGAHQVV
jgi:hypothetical protein